MIFIGAFIFSSCKKNNEKDCSLSETNIVGKYKVTSFKYQASATSPEQDFFDQLFEPCEKDDITVLLLTIPMFIQMPELFVPQMEIIAEPGV